MRWNMFLSALVVSVGLGSQSFGFELLDAMLGYGGHGGCGHASSCCAEPSCCEPEPSCCEPEPSCCEPEASCCEPAPCCHKRHHGHGLLDGLFGHGCHKQSCCGSCGDSCCEPEPSCCEPEPSCCEPEPSCCEPAPCCHKRHHCGFLSGLFGHGRHRNSCCNSCGGCDSCGGCGAATSGGEAAEGDDAAPMPPAPMADPQASLRSKRRVVQTASIVRRN